MLRRVGETVDSKDAVVKIKDASFPTPFVSALEYNSPVHGNWNIVHTGMQVPESIQIYVCADNCMRGVVLTAAEMNAVDRFSFVMNYRYRKEVTRGEKLIFFCQLASQYADELRFTDTYEISDAVSYTHLTLPTN